MKVSKILSLLLAASSSLLFANEKTTDLDKYISENKNEQFRYDYQKNEAEGSKLRDSWIAPLNLSYSYSKSNPYETTQVSKNAAIRMDQPIFQTGGIYYGIKFAKASKLYADYSVDIAKRKMIKDAISLLMQIKQTGYRISKQKYLIKNADINLELKKDQYMSGQLDSSFLDSAIIERNSVIQTLYDIETSKEKLISTFSTISDISHETASIPHLELLTKDEFLKNNLVVNMTKSQVERDKYNKNVTIAKYLPKVSITAGYNWSETNSKFNFGSAEKEYKDYGIKVTIPISINTFRDIESAKIDYLKSEIVAQDKKRELNALFEQVVQNIDNLDKKKLLSVENIGIYQKLLDDTKELYKAGYKTEYDVETLANSVVISELDSKIYEIDKQLELLNLYEMYVNDF